MDHVVIMWFIILAGTLVISLAGVVFLLTRFMKFEWVRRRCGKSRWRRALFSLCITLAGSALIGKALGVMNLAIVLIYLALIWLVCECILRYLRRKVRYLRELHYYLAGILALSITCCYLGYAYFNDRHVVVTEYEISTEKNVEPLNIVMFSDSHIGTTFSGKGMAKHIDKINALNPDVVLIVGDFIDGSSSYEDVFDAAEALSHLQTRYGIWFTFGNHDKNHYGEDQGRSFRSEDFRRILEDNGVHILEDQIAELPGGYELIGRQDKEVYGRATIFDLMEQTDPEHFTIDMNHQPNDYDNEQIAHVDLVLSGHTHGGQLLLIRDVGLWIGANDRIYGYEKRGNTNYIVSSGLSDWAIDFKTGCVSEIVQIKVHR